MTATFTAKCIFGLGVTSSTDFVELASRHKPLKEAGIAYINAISKGYPTKSGVVVFEGLREVFRCYKHIRSHQVMVVSEVPSILKELADYIPLDWDNTRSFEFNFKAVDIQAVIKAVRSKKLQVTSRFVAYSNLGYHVDRVSNSGEFISAYLALTGALPFNKRDAIRRALVKFLAAKRVNAPTVIVALQEATAADPLLKEQIERFTRLWLEQAEAYHTAINSPLAPALSSKKYGVDQYAISYLKRMIRSDMVTNNRLERNGSKLETA